jgi:hypothetical protein
LSVAGGLAIPNTPIKFTEAFNFMVGGQGRCKSAGGFFGFKVLKVHVVSPVE